MKRLFIGLVVVMAIAESVGSSAAVGSGGANNGTSLSLLLTTGPCSGGHIQLQLQVTTSGASAPATISASVDNGAQFAIAVIGTEDWVANGRYKTASVVLPVDSGFGSHTIALTVAQQGSDGKVASTAAVPVSC